MIHKYLYFVQYELMTPLDYAVNDAALQELLKQEGGVHGFELGPLTGHLEKCIEDGQVFE